MAEDKMYSMTHPRNDETVIEVREDRARELHTRGWLGYSGPMDEDEHEPRSGPVEHPYAEGNTRKAGESQSKESRGENNLVTEQRVSNRTARAAGAEPNPKPRRRSEKIAVEGPVVENGEKR